MGHNKNLQSSLVAVWERLPGGNPSKSIKGWIYYYSLF
jgi:hypothetical protein